MVKVCAVRFCRKKGKGILRFPSDPKLREEWCDILKLCPEERERVQNKCVCYRHFRPDIDFTINDNRYRLKRNAVPCLNLNGPPVDDWYLKEEASGQIILNSSPRKDKIIINSDKTLKAPTAPVLQTPSGVVIRKVVKRKEDFALKVNAASTSASSSIEPRISVPEKNLETVLKEESDLKVKPELVVVEEEGEPPLQQKVASDDNTLVVQSDRAVQPFEHIVVSERPSDFIEASVPSSLSNSRISEADPCPAKRPRPVSRRQMLLISSSAKKNQDFLQHKSAKYDGLLPFLKRNKVNNVLFIPHARTDHAEAAFEATKAFFSMRVDLESLHNFEDKAMAVRNAKAILVGDGNAFRLLKALSDLDLMDAIRRRVIYEGLPYVGVGAGSVVAGITVHVCDDMPVVFPPSPCGMELVPINITCHYIPPSIESRNSTFSIPTKMDKILSYTCQKNSETVLALGVGHILSVDQDKMMVSGEGESALIKSNSSAKNEYEVISTGSDLSSLLEETILFESMDFQNQSQS